MKHNLLNLRHLFNRSAGTCSYQTYRFAMIKRIERIEQIYLMMTD